MKTQKEYRRFGTWRVTTEGDEEGRTVRELGSYTGNFDEIAFALADKEFYKLTFEMVDAPPTEYKPVRDRVNISFHINSGTWDMHHLVRTQFFRRLLQDTDIDVTEGQLFASVKLVTPHFKPKDVIRAEALAKLTKEEKEALELDIKF